MGWTKVTLTNDQITTARHIALQESFTGIFFTALNPPDAGMFEARSAHEGVYYFSPRASEIAKWLLDRYGAQPCDPPSWDDVSPLVVDAAFDWASAMRTSPG